MKEQQTEDINRRIKLSRVQFFSLHDGREYVQQFFFARLQSALQMVS